MQGTGPYKSFSPLSSSKLFSSGASGWSNLVLNQTRHNSQKTENQQYAIHNYWKVITNTTHLLFLKLWVSAGLVNVLLVPWHECTECEYTPKRQVSQKFRQILIHRGKSYSLVDYQSMTRNPVSGVSRISALLTCSYHKQENTLIPALCSYDALPTLLMEVLHY